MEIFSCVCWIWLYLALPSWSTIESKLPSELPPVFENSLPDSAIAKDRPVLYRDRNAICPYSQQVWLAFEAKGVDYATVLVPSSSCTSCLKVTWPDGTEQTDSRKILERIDKDYPSVPPKLYPKGISECVDSVRCNIVRFDGVFPRRTNPTIYAPYLFKQDGSLVANSQHMVTLEETDEVLEEYYQGPFLCGKDFTAADIVWAPFLERYAVQLPCMHPGKPELNPRGGGEYPALREWFEAMEAHVPSYSCRVQGNVPFYISLLEKEVQQHNEEFDGSVTLSQEVPMFPKHEVDSLALWQQYSKDRPWLAETPEEECAAYIVRNRHGIIDDASKALSMNGDDVDVALREVIGSLLDQVGDKLSGNARDVAAFVNDRIAVPRDMGMIPAETLNRIVDKAPAPRIA